MSYIPVLLRGFAQEVVPESESRETSQDHDAPIDVMILPQPLRIHLGVTYL